MSLSNKFILAILSIIFFIVSLFTYTAIDDQKKLLDNELNKRISLMKDNLKQNASFTIKYYKSEVENDLASMSISHIDTLFDQLVQREDVDGISITNPNKNIHIFSGIKAIKDVDRLTFEEQKEHILVSMPIELTKKWGTITIVYSLDKLNHEVQKAQKDFENLVSKNIRNAILTAFITAFIFSILSYIWAKKLTSPILLLTKTAQKIAKGEIEEHKELAAITSKDEVGALSKAFLTMSHELNKSYKELKSLNEDLEKKVARRTKNLESERNKLNTLLDVTMEAIVVSKDSKCIDINKSALKVFGYDSKEEMIGKSIFDFVAPESHELIKKKLMIDFTSSYEAFALKKDNKKFPAYIKGVNFNDEGLRISSILDISHLKQLESHKKLASMGEMIGNIAHQWRQPLSVISTASSGIQLQHEYGMLGDEELNKMCNTINENTLYLSQTIDDFRNYITGDSEAISFNLKNNMESFIKLVNITIKENNIQLIVNVETDKNIKGYPNELIQCFINIFNNSKDAFLENDTDEEHRYIFINQKIEANNIIISFKDSAGGIPEEIISKIFEPYFTTKHQSQGTGLGLHMSYNLIINHMKGSIEALNTKYMFQEKYYNGAEFIITLPYTSADFK